MSTALEIFRAGLADLDDAARLFRAYLGFYEISVPATAAHDFLEARVRNGQSVILLARLDAVVVGFMQLYPAFASLSLSSSWILNDLYVAPQARRLGVAEAMMNAARDLARENGSAEIFLQTARSNTAAQRLYERLGYRRDDEFLVYTLTLPRP